MLDYYDDERIAQQHYIRFRNEVVSQLSCDGAAECWHLTGETIETALAGFHRRSELTPDGGRSKPSLPSNWRAVRREDRTVYQRGDIDHYIVLGEGRERWRIVLCSQGDRAYPAPLAIQTVSVDEDPAPVVTELAEESNDLIGPAEDEE